MKIFTSMVLRILLPLGICYADATEWGKLDSLDGLFYKEGALFTGEVVKYIDGGLMRGEFKDGIRNGHWQTTNRVGEPMLTSYYENGEPHGRWQQWYKNGKPELDANFNFGVFDGPYLEWNQKGKKLVDATYVNGLEHGKYKEWHDNGKKAVIDENNN